MILLAVVLALLLDCFVPYANDLRFKAWHWLEHNALNAVLKGFPAAPYVVTAVVVLVVPILLVIAHALFPDNPIAELVYQTIGLWFVLGPHSLYQELQQENGQLSTSSVLRWRNREQPPADCHLVSESFYRLFLPLFWYIIGGVFVAAIVRALVVFCDQHQTLRETEEQGLIKLLNWIMLLPALALVFTFGLMGHLSEAWQQWKQNQPKDEDHVIHRLHQFEMALGQAARASVGEQDDIQQINNAINRSLMAWVAAIAVISLAGLA